jgi:hypothetical protein
MAGPPLEDFSHEQLKNDLKAHQLWHDFLLAWLMHTTLEDSEKSNIGRRDIQA